MRYYRHLTDLHSAIIMKFFLYEMPLKVSLFLGTTVLGEAKPSCVYEPEQKSAEGRFLEGKRGWELWDRHISGLTYVKILCEIIAV